MLYSLYLWNTSYLPHWLPQPSLWNLATGEFSTFSIDALCPTKALILLISYLIIVWVVNGFEYDVLDAYERGLVSRKQWGRLPEFTNEIYEC